MVYNNDSNLKKKKRENPASQQTLGLCWIENLRQQVQKLPPHYLSV